MVDKDLYFPVIAVTIIEDSAKIIIGSNSFLKMTGRLREAASLKTLTI